MTSSNILATFVQILFLGQQEPKPGLLRVHLSLDVAPEHSTTNRTTSSGRRPDRIPQSRHGQHPAGLAGDKNI